jgi:hypothetical protein
MTRREFSCVLACAGFVPGGSSRVVVLKAIAGARLPETLAITTGADGFLALERMRESVWELRTYKSAPALARSFDVIFPRAGIRPLWQRATGGVLTYLIPFENLTARDRAWTLLNADPDWTSARPEFQSYHFGLYRSV